MSEWQNRPPTRAGHYWFIENQPTGRPRVELVEEYSGKFYVNDAMQGCHLADIAEEGSYYAAGWWQHIPDPHYPPGHNRKGPIIPLGELEDLQPLMFDGVVTGVEDMHGNPICCGDHICCYPDTRDLKQIDEDVYEVVGEQRPEKMVDVPVYSGYVRYYADHAAFVLVFDREQPNGAVSTHHWANGYTLEKI